jgi:hypothetical protein
MIHRSHRPAFFGLAALISASIFNAEVVCARSVTDIHSSSKAAQLTVSEQTIGSGWQPLIKPAQTRMLKPKVSECQTSPNASSNCAGLVRDLKLETWPVINLFPIDTLPRSVRLINITSP